MKILEFKNYNDDVINEIKDMIYYVNDIWFCPETNLDKFLDGRFSDTEIIFIINTLKEITNYLNKNGIEYENFDEIFNKLINDLNKHGEI